MRPVLQALVERLRLERIEDNLFRGQSQDLGWGAIFGGQVLGQALSAADQTVPDDRSVHSLHGYFLRQGDASRPVVYDVDCIRDGKSFTTRRVVAIQNGRAIFNMAASFQRAEPGYDHGSSMPPTPKPQGLPSERDLAEQLGDKIPAKLRRMALAERPIEFRPVDPQNPLSPRAREPERKVWFRASDPLPDDPSLHRYLLAYASDFYLLSTAMYPHGASVMTPGMQVASLDHAMWFHRPFRMDQWVLYAVQSPSAQGARGLVRGQLFTEDGVLVAETVQEGLMRHRGKFEPPTSSDP